MTLGAAALDVLDEVDEAELLDEVLKDVGVNVKMIGEEDVGVKVSMMGLEVVGVMVVDVVSLGSTVVLAPPSPVPHRPLQATI